jgi:hypothetical protein
MDAYVLNNRIEGISLVERIVHTYAATIVSRTPVSLTSFADELRDRFDAEVCVLGDKHYLLVFDDEGYQQVKPSDLDYIGQLNHMRGVRVEIKLMPAPVMNVRHSLRNEQD